MVSCCCVIASSYHPMSTGTQGCHSSRKASDCYIDLQNTHQPESSLKCYVPAKVSTARLVDAGQHQSDQSTPLDKISQSRLFPHGGIHICMQLYSWQVRLYLFIDQLCLQKYQTNLQPRLTLNPHNMDPLQFTSPFGDEIRSESEDEWRSPFPEQEQEKLSPQQLSLSQKVSNSPSQQFKQSSQEQLQFEPKEQSAISIESIVESQSLSLSFDQDLNLQNLSFSDLDMQQPESGQPGAQDSRIKKDLIEMFEQLGEDGRGKFLSSTRPAFEIRDEEWMRRQEKVVAARAFINRGYGINQLKQQLRAGTHTMKIDDTRYKSIAGSMVRQCFRKLEAFLLRDCQQKLHSMAGYEMKLLQTLLLNCRTTLSTTHSNYFLQVVTITYHLSPTSIHQNHCLDLYNAIYRSLQKKIALLRGQRVSDSYSSSDRPRHTSYKPNYSGQVDSSIITADIEREIIEEYVGTPSLSQVRDVIRGRYRISESKLNVKVIRNILRRVMRAAIRRMEEMMGDRGLRSDYRSYQRLSDQKIKHVLEVTEATKLRAQVCKAYLGNFTDTKLIERICKDLSEFVKQRAPHKVHSISLD